MRIVLPPADARIYASYAFTIFLGAFLLFAIQPMAGRSLLPFFGGAVAVWGASLVFFTGCLFLGYAYVHVLHRFPVRHQALIHLFLLACSALIVASSLLYTHSLYTFPTGVFLDGIPPALEVFLALAVSIGIPYFALATTSPLLQQWYSSGEVTTEPYRLYALSNLGSLAALGSYPFLIEPLFSLTVQYALWAVLFLLFAGACGAAAFSLRSLPHTLRAEDTLALPSVMTRIAWLFLSFIPAAMLVATTMYMTQTIAPAPFIWVIPLLLYLTSFVLAFRGWGGAAVIATIVLVAAGASYSLFGYSFYEARTELAVNAALLFFGSLYCHALLYGLRPPREKLSYYYLVISLGGLLGTFFISMIAPLIFLDFFEFLIGVGLFAAAAVAGFPARKYLRARYLRHAIAIKSVLILGIGGFLYMYPPDTDMLHTSRNFYGQIRVREYEGMRLFSHGTTLHGAQLVGSEEREREATTYYIPSSGIARALARMQSIRGGEGINVGVLGLGAGSIAAHCRPQDQYAFYEIDPRVHDVALEYFTYLKHCEGASVRYGDGRLLLEEELKEGRKGNYDILVLSAFSDDTLPTHLITKEAMELYLEHLRGPESILAIITSTRYIDLTSVALRIAEELGLSAVYVYDDAEGYEGGVRSDWVLISKDPDTLAVPSIAEAAWDASAEAPLWTDDYVNLFGVLSLPEWYFWNSD